MAKLSIRTRLDRVVVVGEFCKWSAENAIVSERKKGSKSIVIDDMPKGEYRVLSCKSYIGGEVYPTDGRQMHNRYFGGEADETIMVYFEKEK